MGFWQSRGGGKVLSSEQKEVKYYWQWYWQSDWKGQKCKAIYYGPRLDWMKLFKDEPSNTRKNKRTNRPTKDIS
jgi:hypothetical protein